LFEANGVHRATRDFEVDLHIDVGRARMAERTSRTEEFRNEPAEDHKLGSRSIVVHDAHECRLGGGSRRA